MIVPRGPGTDRLGLGSHSTFHLDGMPILHDTQRMVTHDLAIR